MEELEEKKENEASESDVKIESFKSSSLSEALATQGKKKKKGCHFPTAYTILIIIEILFFILTYIIPKGKYDTIEYSDSRKKFIIKSYGKEDIEVEATESVLEEKGIKIPLKNFLDGLIKDPISIPNTYQRIDEKNNNVFSLFIYPIKGLIDSSGICFFLFVLGGTINLLIEMNSLTNGIAALGRATKGKEFILLILIFLIISIGGTTYGMMEETLPFYPILIPIFMKSGYDAILGVAPLYLGSMVGSMFSTINAFSVVMASYSAGINFMDTIYFRLVCLALGDCLGILMLYLYFLRIKKDEKNSVVYPIKKELEAKYLKDKKKAKEKVVEKTDDKSEDNILEIKEKEEEIGKNEENEENEEDKENENKFTCIQKLGLIALITGFLVMIIGILAFKWSFEEMTGVFLVTSVFLMFLYGKGEKEGIEVFIRGAGDFVGVSLVIGIARGINLTLTEGNVSDTILDSMTGFISSLPKILFAIIMLLIFIFLGFFIQSSSGLAVLAMPVLAPLADSANCDRSVVVNTYMFGQFLIGFIAPTGFILIVLQMVEIPYNFWLKFIWPILLAFFIFLIILVILNAAFFS